MTPATLFAIIVTALIVLIFIGVAAAGYHFWRRHRVGSGSRDSLYARLGGVFAIAALVDHFSDALLDNPMVGVNSPNQYLRDWSRNKRDRLPGLKFMRTLWLCAVSGGPFHYSPTAPGRCPFSLENAHRGLQIAPGEFDAVAAELANSLDYFKVADPERSEVLAAFAAHKEEVVAGYNQAHGQPVTPPKC
jgi:hemoglobin